jgi:phage-related protein
MADRREKRIEADFYRTSGGNVPVLDWLRSLDPQDKKIVGSDIRKVELEWPVGEPLCRPLGTGICEVRSTLSDGTIARVLFGILDDRMLLLHAFVKKTRKTPKEDLDLARKRLAEAKRGTK